MRMDVWRNGERHKKAKSFAHTMRIWLSIVNASAAKGAKKLRGRKEKLFPCTIRHASANVPKSGSFLSLLIFPFSIHQHQRKILIFILALTALGRSSSASSLDNFKHFIRHCGRWMSFWGLFEVFWRFSYAQVLEGFQWLRVLVYSIIRRSKYFEIEERMKFDLILWKSNPTFWVAAKT